MASACSVVPPFVALAFATALIAQDSVSRPESVLALHEISDLLSRACSFESNDPRNPGPGPAIDECVQLLTASVRELVSPAFDEGRHGLLIAREPASPHTAQKPPVLVTKLTAEQQRWLADFLER